MPSRGWRLIRFDMRLSVICLWPGLLSKLAGIIKREEVIFKEGGETSEQMKTEVGGQREERKIEAYIPCRVSCGALCRTQTINLQTTTARQPFCLQSSKAITTLKTQHLLLWALLCTQFKALVVRAHRLACFCQADQRDPRLSHFPGLKCVFS